MTMQARVPPLMVFWVCGASGSGKSVAAWELFERVAAAGGRVAYVDIDQLGMLHPAPEDGPRWHHAVKAEALSRSLPGWADAGVQLLVVSGVVDAHEGPRAHLPPDVELTLCLLVADPAALRERVLARRWGEAAADEAVAEQEVLRAATFPDVRLETAGLSVAQTVDRLQDFVRVVSSADEQRPPLSTSRATTPVVFVTGPRAAGSSTVGFGLAVGRWRADRRTGFLDLQQLGFLARDGLPGVDAPSAVGRLAVLHEFMGERGAELVVVSGHLSVADRAQVRESLAAACVTIVRLRADERTLTEHVRARVDGSDARLAGDDLVDASRAHQEAVVAASLAEQRMLDAVPADDVVLDVSGRSAAEVVAEIQRLVGRRG